MPDELDLIKRQIDILAWAAKQRAESAFFKDELVSMATDVGLRIAAYRDGKTISAATAETLKQVQALHDAASSAIDGLLSPDDSDVAAGDGDDQPDEGDDGTESEPSPGADLEDGTGGTRSRPQSSAVRVLPVARPVPIPAI